jgi:serine/threonine protein kinase
MIGSQIGNFRILEKLGEGGMGVVYKGIDIQLERSVAIKMLGSDLAGNPELVQRFQAEARAQANLNHTNIATLYAFLVDQGRAFMVMEFVEGETFDQIIRRGGPMHPGTAVPLFKQALLGIGAAHRMGIIHRDIKPSNLMLNRQAIVKVMDFGIAKALGTRGMTRTGMQMGTLAYMSPEQITNRGVDARSDIYALGITLYEMLTGHVPFESDSDFQVMHDHVNTPPPALVRHYAYAPREFEGVVAKALAKNPDFRFQTVEEFGAALEHPENVSAPLPPPLPVHPPMGQTIIDTGAGRFSGAGAAPPPPYSGQQSAGPVAATATPPPIAPTYQSPAYGTVVDASGRFSSGAAAAPATALGSQSMPPTAVVGPGSTPPPIAPAGMAASVPQTPPPARISGKMIAAISGAAILIVLVAAIFWPKSSSSGGGGGGGTGGGSISGGGGGGGGASQPTPSRQDSDQIIASGGSSTTPSGDTRKIGDQEPDQSTPGQDQGKPRHSGVGDEHKKGGERVDIAKNQPPPTPHPQQTPVPSTPEPTPPPTPAPTPYPTPYATPYPTPNPTPQRQNLSVQNFRVKHRHVVMYGFQSQTYFCAGVLSVGANGAVAYACGRTADPSGRCEQVVFPPGTIRKLTMKGGELHIGTSSLGNWDFFDLDVAGHTAGAYQAILPFAH